MSPVQICSLASFSVDDIINCKNNKIKNIIHILKPN